MSDPARVRRYAERIKELVASALRKQVKDPRLGMVTITDVRLTNDLHDATLFYTVLGDPTEQAATTAALGSANGLLRSIVGKRLGLRFAPTLTFVIDEVPEQADHIEQLLAAARQADAEVQRQAVDAQYAGEAQPYKVDEDEDEDDVDDVDDVDEDVETDEDRGDAEPRRHDGDRAGDAARADGGADAEMSQARPAGGPA